MSHVDEGALHAYLDGALEEYPAAEARAVREHLEVCAACRERLEVERGVRDEAASILGLAVPEVEVPSFEELRAYVRANASGRSSVSVRIYRLGWAASIVLALGTGWMLRGGQVVPVASPIGAAAERASRQESAASFDVAAAAVVALERSAEEAPAAGARANEAAAVGEAQSAPAPGIETAQRQAAVAEPAEPETDRASTSPATSGGTVAPAPVADAPIDDIAPRPEAVADIDASIAVASPASGLDGPAADNGQRRRLEVAAAPDSAAFAPEPAAPTEVRERVADAAGARNAPEPERRSASPDVVASANAAAPAVGLAGRAPDFADARDEVPADQESYSLVVPNVEVLEVRFRGSGVQSEGQVVLQRLESGDTLEVIHLPPEMDPSSLEEPAPGDAELVVQRAAGWIVMRAPLREAELMELMERLLTER